MNILEKMKSHIFGADPEIVAAYHTVLPKRINVSVKKDGDYLLAKINTISDKKIDGLLITEAKDFDSLISSVNDLMYTYVNMPENVRPYYGDVFKPEDYNQNSKDLVLVKAWWKMGIFYRPSSYRKMYNFLKNKNFTLRQGGGHLIATFPDNSDIEISVPRHNKLSNGLTEEICLKLVELGFEKNEIIKKILQ